MKIRATLFALLITSAAQANNNTIIDDPVYKYLGLNAQEHMKALGFAYMQKLKLEVASKNHSYMHYLNTNIDQMTKEQIIAEDAKLDRMMLDETCLNLYFDEIVMQAMEGNIIKNIKKTYDEDKNKIKATEYDCNTNINRILQDIGLIK